MIFNTFSRDEINDGIRGVVAEFSNSSYPVGLEIKYEKALKNRKVKDGNVLGVHRYTIQNNTVYVVAIKRTYNYSPRKYGELVFNYYVSVTNPNTGKSAYAMPCFDIYGAKIIGFTLLTEHFIQRLRERAGVEFSDFLKKSGGMSGHAVVYGDDGKIETNWGGHRLFGYQYEDGKYTYITTMVTDDMLFETQLPVKEYMAEREKEYKDIQNSTLTV